MPVLACKWTRDRLHDALAHLKPPVRSLIFSSIPLKCLFWIALGVRTRVNSLIGEAWYNIGSTHYDKTLPESIAYIESVVADYRRYGRIDAFHGRVAELGPGDSAGVAMLVRGGGAVGVELIERYPNDRRPEQQQEICRTLAERHALQWLDRSGEWHEDELGGIAWTMGKPAEEVLAERARTAGSPYDFILSSGMLEHADDPERVLELCVACLRPGGRAVHRLDLDDHNLFSQNHPELTFLRIPQAVHRFMIMARSGPNRARLDRYLQALKRLRTAHGIAYRVYVTSLFGVGRLEPAPLIDEVKPVQWRRAVSGIRAQRATFARAFRRIDERHLAVSGAFLVLEKPPAPD